MCAVAGYARSRVIRAVPLGRSGTRCSIRGIGLPGYRRDEESFALQQRARGSLGAGVGTGCAAACGGRAGCGLAVSPSVFGTSSGNPRLAGNRLPAGQRTASDAGVSPRDLSHWLARVGGHDACGLCRGLPAWLAEPLAGRSCNTGGMGPGMIVGPPQCGSTSWVRRRRCDGSRPCFREEVRRGIGWGRSPGRTGCRRDGHHGFSDSRARKASRFGDATGCESPDGGVIGKFRKMIRDRRTEDRHQGRNGHSERNGIRSEKDRMQAPRVQCMVRDARRRHGVHEGRGTRVLE